MEKRKRGWWGWATVGVGVILYEWLRRFAGDTYPSVIEIVRMIFAAVIGWFSLWWVLLGIGGVVLFGLGVVVGRITASPRRSLLPKGAPPGWIGHGDALALLRRHPLVITEAESLRDMGRAGFVGALHQRAEATLERFCMQFGSSRRGDWIARKDLMDWADRTHEDVRAGKIPSYVR